MISLHISHFLTCRTYSKSTITCRGCGCQNLLAPFQQVTESDYISHNESVSDQRVLLVVQLSKHFKLLGEVSLGENAQNRRNTKNNCCLQVFQCTKTSLQHQTLVQFKIVLHIPLLPRTLSRDHFYTIAISLIAIIKFQK